MKTALTLGILLILTPAALTLPACQAPASRVAQVTTLKVLGASVDETMKVAAGLFHDGRITLTQWARIAAFHDQKFQPAYRLAVAAVKADLSSMASPDLVGLAAQLLDLVKTYIPAPTK